MGNISCTYRPQNSLPTDSEEPVQTNMNFNASSTQALKSNFNRQSQLGDIITVESPRDFDDPDFIGKLK